MAEQTVEPELIEQLKKLQAKYDAMGQDLSSYLDGLLYSDYLTYWDYIHLDTLLSLQTPKTHFDDEKVFIMYHQITELYFQLIIHELEQIAAREPIDAKFFIERLDRLIRYFENLEASFDIMVHGMEKGSVPEIQNGPFAREWFSVRSISPDRDQFNGHDQPG